MFKKVLIVCPDVPEIGGAGKFLWDLAYCASKHSSWETHLLTPLSKKHIALGEEIDYVHGMPGKVKRYWNESALEMIKKAAALHNHYDYDLTYIISEMSLLPAKHLLGGLSNIVFGVHSQQYHFSNLDMKRPILEQYKNLKKSKSFKELEEVEKFAGVWHLISGLEEKIWNELHPEKENYIVLPDMIKEMLRFSLPWEERTDNLMFSGRITGYAKGLSIIRQFLEAYPEKTIDITVPRNNLARAIMLYKKYPNCNLKYYSDHNDVLREMGRHKVFVNAGTYGPFDLTMIEALSQGCQIVAGASIGGTQYIPSFIPKNYTLKAFEEQIEDAFSMDNINWYQYPSMDFYAQDFLDTLYNCCMEQK